MKMIGTIEEIIETFPYIGESHETQNGFNFEMDGKTFAFYYNNKPTRKNVIVFQHEVEYFRPGKELEALATLIKRTAPRKEPEPTKLSEGTLKCISQIEQRIERLNADTSRGNMRVVQVLKEMIVLFKTNTE